MRMCMITGSGERVAGSFISPEVVVGMGELCLFLGEWGRGVVWCYTFIFIYVCGGMKMAVREGIYTRRMCNTPPWRHPKHSETIGRR